MRRFPVPLLPRWLRLLGVVVVGSVIAYFSLVGSVAGPPTPEPFWDKRLHLAAYGAFTLALAYATANSPHSRRRRVSLVLVLAVGFGAVIELVQGPLPGRYLSGLDLLANVLGVLLASVWFWIEPHVRYVPLETDAENN